MGSNSLSLSSVINKNAVSSDVPLLMALTVKIVDPDTLQHVETVRVVHNNEDVTIKGENYVAAAFDISITESAEKAPTVTLTMVDITQTIQRYLQQYKGGSQSEIIVHIFFAPSTVIDYVDVEYNFSVVSASSSSSDYSVSWTLGAENPLTLPLPARMQMRERCQWVYKSEDCGYAGSKPTCDLSLDGINGCRAHDNTVRFGGLPGITVRNV